MRLRVATVVLVLGGLLLGQTVQFVNVTKAARIDFVHLKGNNGTSTILEEAGPGVCVADFDGDGSQDIYFVNGRDLYKRGIPAQNALYRNNGDGTFSDVTAKAGVLGSLYGLGCVAGDYDNDGFPDLYVTQYGRNILYHNNGNGTFTDVTEKAGVPGIEFGTVFHTGATFLTTIATGASICMSAGMWNLAQRASDTAPSVTALRPAAVPLCMAARLRFCITTMGTAPSRT